MAMTFILQQHHLTSDRLAKAQAESLRLYPSWLLCLVCQLERLEVQLRMLPLSYLTCPECRLCQDQTSRPSLPLRSCMEYQLSQTLPARELLLLLLKRLLRLTHLSQKSQPVLLQSPVGLEAALRGLYMAILAEEWSSYQRGWMPQMTFSSIRLKLQSEWDVSIVSPRWTTVIYDHSQPITNLSFPLFIPLFIPLIYSKVMTK